MVQWWLILCIDQFNQNTHVMLHGRGSNPDLAKGQVHSLKLVGRDGSFSVEMLRRRLKPRKILFHLDVFTDVLRGGRDTNQCLPLPFPGRLSVCIAVTVHRSKAMIARGMWYSIPLIVMAEQTDRPEKSHARDPEDGPGGGRNLGTPSLLADLRDYNFNRCLFFPVQTCVWRLCSANS